MVPEARLELAVFSSRGVATFPLASGKELVVGRAVEADIRIDDTAVSRRHAIFHVGPPLEVEDLGSSNGTFVSPAGTRKKLPRAEGEVTTEQKRVQAKRMRLAVGDSVFFGDAVVVVREARDTTTSPAAGREVVVKDPALVRLYDEAKRAAQMTLPILILGETGVGKDVLARFIHENSPRAQKPLVALDCAALSPALAESELFGHGRGAFTGAEQARAGLFESAHGGTVFLDELAELPLQTQAKLLRALESAEVTRLGTTKPIKIDVRFLSATNRDLEREVEGGRFRQDLYFRVNGITLNVPPLRARTVEIPLLAQRFLQTASRKAGLLAPEISEEALAVLTRYAWPGNVRQLRYVMERALVTAATGPIMPSHLPPQIGSPESTVPPANDRQDAASRERVIEALARADGNQTRAAELLGVSRRTLINRMIEFGLPRPRKN